MERYPADTTVTLENLRQSGWREAIASCEREDYSIMSQSLLSAAQLAVKNARFSEGKGLFLLADACSMMLNPESQNEPFKPSWVGNSHRSWIPSDFQQADLDLFAEFVGEVDDPRLQARLADLLWLLIRPRNQQYALLAIDAYCQLPLDEKTWFEFGKDCWQRAMSLAQMLGQGADDRLQQIKKRLFEAFNNSTKEDGYFASSLADLLPNKRLEQADRLVVASKLESIARAVEGDNDFLTARDYFLSASKWFKLRGENVKAAEMIAFQAECLVKEAEARLLSDQPSNMVAARFYEDAIQAYRNIPRRERSALRVDERIAELHQKLTEAGKKSLDEMVCISSPAIDIREDVEVAVNKVRGKSTPEALATFCNIYRGVNAGAVLQFSEESFRKPSLFELIPKTYRSPDGRVSAKSSGIGSMSSDSDEYKTALRAKMIKRYQMEWDFVVHGSIWPALEVLRLEHRLSTEDFMTIVNRCPLIPMDRKNLMGRALFAGYDNDFITALHLLVPQIEHLVRCLLKNAGVKTTTLDKNGIETENGLSTLMELPEVEQIFGKDTAFEIRALFCDALGPNLRNNLAHGLLNDDDCQSTYSIYAWWFWLRIVFNSFWREVHPPQSASDCP